MLDKPLDSAILTVEAAMAFIFKVRVMHMAMQMRSDGLRARCQPVLFAA
jgi:hypothetical protein